MENAEKRKGRFLVQELDEEELAKKCRHYSIINRTHVNDLPDSFLQENENMSCFCISQNIPFVLDCENNNWVNFNEVWNIFSNNLIKETKDMQMMFKFDHINKNEDSSSDYNNFPNYSTDKETNEDFSVWYRKHIEDEYDDLKPSGGFIMNRDDSGNDQDTNIFDS